LLHEAQSLLKHRLLLVVQALPQLLVLLLHRLNVLAQLIALLLGLLNRIAGAARIFDKTASRIPLASNSQVIEFPQLAQIAAAHHSPLWRKFPQWPG
jgi:hypothetical protein